MPSSDDLPTPEPAKTPRRWPRPHGTSVSSARTPRSSRSVMRLRPSGAGGLAAVERIAPPSSGGPPSIGRPRPSSTRPSSIEPICSEKGLPVGSTEFPGPTPRSSPSGMSSVRPSRKPTTSAAIGGWLRPHETKQTSPIDARRPVASITRPIRFATSPRRTRTSERSTVSATRSSTPSAHAEGAIASRTISAARAICAAAVPSISASSVWTMQPPRSTRRSGTTSTRARPSASAMPPIAALHEVEVVGAHLDDDAAAILQAAQRRRDDVDDELGPHEQRGADDLLRQQRPPARRPAARRARGAPCAAVASSLVTAASAASASATRARPSSSPAA